MQNSGYEMFALFMRYVFVFLMALILLRSLWWLRKDARQFRKELKQENGGAPLSITMQQTLLQTRVY